MVLAAIVAAGCLASALTVEARRVLEASCGSCHGGGDAEEGGFDFLFQREALVREGLVVPGSAKRSPLWLRMRKREMPPPSAKLHIGPAQVAAVGRWIDAGAPLEGFEEPRVPPSRLSYARAVEFARRDAAMGSTPDTFRYFAATAGERSALAKALNSLSWQPQLMLPVSVGDGLVRVDLASLGWRAQDWELLAQAYPYGLELGSGDEVVLRRLTGSATPVLRADWFVATALRPPLYHSLARSPADEAALERQLNVRVKTAIASGAVVRIGFTRSGVSQHNRLLERHAARSGPYWRSYDFGSSVGSRNIFERPLAFVHDGGEHIFTLPNGMLGFLLTDGRGQRIDRGPTSIVRDPRRPDGAVENGLSCMGCHANGLLPKADELGQVVRENPSGYSAGELRAVARLHTASKVDLFDDDSQRFRAALDALGVDRAAEEPITQVALAYESDLDLARAAEELGVQPQRLQAALKAGPPAVAALTVFGAVKRDAFVSSFGELAVQLGVGRPSARRRAPTGRPPPTCGLQSRSLEARLSDCALAFPEVTRPEAWALVARDEAGREVWFDRRQRLLWGELRDAAPQSQAASQCAQAGLIDALWFLPSAEQLDAALSAGLPGSAWAMWSRDVLNTEKYNPRGVAVGPGGRQEVPQSRPLASRCAARP